MTNAVACPFCGSETAAPSASGALPDFEAAFLAALESPAAATPDALWDLLCLALRFPSAEARVEHRIAEVGMADLAPQHHCLFGLYLARRPGDEAEAAAHFATAHDAGAERLESGPAAFEFRPTDKAAVDVWLSVEGQASSLGRLDKETIQWESCTATTISLPNPIGWADWTTRVGQRAAAALAMWDAVTLRHEGRAVGDTGFRTHWKDFQHALGEQRDRLEPPPELLELQAHLDGRVRQALRQLDIPRCVSTLVESSRNALRIRADALRAERAAESSVHARQAFSQAFVDGCLDDVLDLREALRGETSTAHAELRKALDYQGRLLRTAQEALNASLSDIGRRAGGLLWPLAPQALFAEAREQAELVVERAREVAMIEQTDAYLQNLSASIEAAGNETAQELVARKNQLEPWRRGLERLASTIGAPLPSVRLPALRLRETFRDADSRKDGMGEILDGIAVGEGEAVLVGAR